VRCSSALTCTGSTTTSVTVTCPGGVSSQPAGGQTISANGKTTTTISWPNAELVDVIRGDLITLRTNKTYTGSVSTCVGDNVLVNSVIDATAAPGAGAGYYWLLRPVNTGCNRPSVSWGDGSPTQDLGTDAEINADSDTCP
jgi:hypothetical protein